MAVSKVRKLEIFAHGERRDEVLAELRKLAAVHISDVRELLPVSEDHTPPFLESSIAQAEAKLADIKHCLEFGEKFLPKPPMTQALFRGRPVFTRHEVDEIIATFELEDFSGECASTESELRENENQIAKKEILIEDIGHWLHLDSPLEQIHDTPRVRVSLGVCDTRSYHALLEELATVSPLHHAEMLELSRTSVSVILIYLKDLEESFTPVLRKYGWRPVQFVGLTGTPSEITERLREQIQELYDRNQQIKERIVREFLPVRDKLLLLHDHYSQELRTLKVQRNFLFTSRTFVVNGWVVASEERNLRRSLNQVTKDIEIRCYDAGPNDAVPILLKNRPAIKPFSLITEMYGRPQYREFDPTPFLFPFFVVFFGVCLGDAGYGLVLALGSFVILKKFKVGGGARNLLHILVWGGLSSAVFGLLTGGIFGITPATLPPVLRKLIVFNPAEQVVLFLYFAFLLGLIQILFGLGVKMARDLRDRDFASAIIDEGLWMLVLVAAAPLFYKYLFGGKLNESVSSFAARAALVLVIPLIIGKGRHTRNIFLVPLLGLVLWLRDALGVFGDVLSYARLMALGLATTFLAMTINIIAELVSGIPFGIGFAFAILILIGGHAFNLAINCMGAFVHTLRLQYLEFFSKFFIGGGQPFRPFAEERQYTVIQSDSAR